MQSIKSVTSIVYNVYDFICGKFTGDFNEFKYYQMRRNFDHVERCCKDLWNSLENHHYTTNELIKALLLEFLIEGELSIYSINNNKLKANLKSVSRDDLKRDNKIIIDIVDSNNLSINQLFEIRETGTCIVFDLLRKKFLSMSFIIKNHKHFLTNLNKDVIIKYDKNYKKFLRVLNKYVTL